MSQVPDEDVLQRLADYANAQTGSAARQRRRAGRFTVRGHTGKAELSLARSAAAERVAADILNLIVDVRSMQEAAAACRAGPAAPPRAAPAADEVRREETSRLAIIAEAASNAVAHLEKIAPTANPVLMHENVLKAFRWLHHAAAADAKAPAAISPSA